MKKYFLLLLQIVICGTVMAQQKPHYTQYLLNQYILNPALTGIENYTDIKFSYRQQWAGFTDAPVTTYFTLHTPLGKKDYRTTALSRPMEDENPRGKNYWEEYTPAAPHHGIGLQVINDVTGPLSHFAAYGTYAYHMGLNPRTNISAGIGAGITSVSLNRSKLNFENQADPSVGTYGKLGDIVPDFMAGVYLYSADYFAGISCQQVVPQRLNFAYNTVSTLQGKLVPHFFATGGYRFLVGQDFNLIPSVMVKFVNPLPVQFDLNAKLQYLDAAWAGLGYRYKDGFNAMAGMNILKNISLSYSYDYSTSKINAYSHGTHEIVLGFIMGNKYDDSCPRNVW